MSIVRPSFRTLQLRFVCHRGRTYNVHHRCVSARFCLLNVIITPYTVLEFSFVYYFLFCFINLAVALQRENRAYYYNIAAADSSQIKFFCNYGLISDQARHERVVFRVWIFGNIPHWGGVVSENVRAVPAGKQTLRFVCRGDFRVLSTLRRTSG